MVHVLEIPLQAFPCNQFMGQEPLTPEEMPAYLASKGITHPVFEPVDVNGDDTHPLFQWLKDSTPGLLVNTVKWNYTKFLLVNGVPYKRFGPTESLDVIDAEIALLVKAAAMAKRQEL